MNGEEQPLSGASTQAAVLTGEIAAQDPSQDDIAASLALAQLPQAPLAMPKQPLERERGGLLSGLLSAFGAGKSRARG